MTPLEWITAFSMFAKVTDLVEGFTKLHPELRAPPKEPEQQRIDDEMDYRLKAKFGDHHD